MAETEADKTTAQDKESPSGRNPDEIALELMKFIAVTTGYGKAASGSTGFSGKPASHSAEEHTEALLELFDRCRKAVKGQ